MRYVTSIERPARCDGLREGIDALLHLRFGAEGCKLMPEMQPIHEEEKLRTILRASRTAANPEDIRQLLAHG